MKKIVAAFLWNSSNKSISFMLINKQHQYISAPQIYHLATTNFKKFRRQSERIIREFYQAIREAYHTHPRHDIKIEYKIVHPVANDLDMYYQPNEYSEFIRKKFLAHYAHAKSMVLPLALSQQLRSKLKRPALDKFKNHLRKIEIVKPSRHNTYQYHLWALATHATKSNYKTIMKRLSKLKHLQVKLAS